MVLPWCTSFNTLNFLKFSSYFQRINLIILHCKILLLLPFSCCFYIIIASKGLLLLFTCFVSLWMIKWYLESTQCSCFLLVVSHDLSEHFSYVSPVLFTLILITNTLESAISTLYFCKPQLTIPSIALDNQTLSL